MNLGQLARVGFIERKGDMILEGPLLDLLMDTDTLKDRIINGALSDIFHLPAPRTPAVIAADTVGTVDTNDEEIAPDAE